MPIHGNHFLLCYVIRDFKGPEVQHFDLQYLEIEENSGKQYLTKDAQTNVLNNVQPYFVCYLDPRKSFRTGYQNDFPRYLKRGN